MATEIKKKLHGIRTQYLAELQKIKKSEASGAGHDDIYLPKLWCFKILQFLYQGATVVAKGESNMLSQIYSQASILDESQNERECDEEVSRNPQFFLTDTYPIGTYV